MNQRLYVLGSINIDLSIECHRFPKIGETIQGFGFEKTLGGKGCNQAIAVSVLGIDTYLIGAVGADDDNGWIYDELTSYHVDSTFVTPVSNVSTGTALIVRANGDNSIILDAGANGQICQQNLLAALDRASENDIFLTQFEMDINFIQDSINLAAQKGMTVIVNPAPVKKIAPSLYAQIDYLIVNQTEAESLTGLYPETVEDCQSVFKMLHSYGLGQLIVTLGKKGSVCVNEAEAIFAESILIDSTDSTGAGDAFIGMFIASLSMAIPMKQRLYFANIAGALTCLHRGARIGVKDIHSIIEFKEEEDG